MTGSHSHLEVLAPLTPNSYTWTHEGLCSGSEDERRGNERETSAIKVEADNEEDDTGTQTSGRHEYNDFIEVPTTPIY